jgi:protein-disulfide isomerase
MIKFIGLAALLLSGSVLQAQTPSPAKAAPPQPLDKPKLEAYVRHLLFWSPQISVTISDPVPSPIPGFNEVTVTGSFEKAALDETFYVSADGKEIIRGAVYETDKSPFASELSKLKTDLSPSIGTPGAPVVIVLFSDFQCAFCREEAKMLRENLIKTYPKEIRLYFKEFPIEQLHPWAKSAAIAGRCIFRQNPAAFWAFHDWIFDKQGEINVTNLQAKIGEWVKANSATLNLDPLQFSRCSENRSTEAEVNKSIAEARALRVQSTPTMFINGRPIPGSMAWPQLKQIIDWELDYSKKTGESGEKCCEVSLPVPGRK